MRKYFFIFLLLIGSYFISNFAINNIFLAQSPKINPFFAQNMMARINNLWSRTGSFFAFRSTPSNNKQLDNESSNNNFFNLFQQNVDETNNISSEENQPNEAKPTIAQSDSFLSDELKDALATPLTRVSQGVYAGEHEDIKVYEIRINEVDSTVYTFKVNGKEIKIKVPKDKEPPTQEEMEEMF